MAAQLAFGNVPTYYREVYDSICSRPEDKLDHDLFAETMKCTGLQASNISVIWDIINPSGSGVVTRDGLYKGLALIALAQQGKPVSDKVLESLADSDLPKPVLCDLADLKTASSKVRRERSPNFLGFTYKELTELDRIEVELEPERKGLILKHREYTVSSRRFNTSVQRRYNDFVVFHDLLMARFPYRLVPRLPPKKIGASKEFIEDRRRCLKRFLQLIARHPIMTEDQSVSYFLTFKGSDMGGKMKEHFKGFPDEFLTNPLASRSKDLVPSDTQIQLPSSKEQIKLLHASLSILQNVVDGLASRSLGMAQDMYCLSKELKTLANDPNQTSSWATGGNNIWDRLKQGFQSIIAPVETLATKSLSHSEIEQERIADYLAMYLDLTGAFKELIERHEKGVLRDHQLALHKMQQYKQRHMSGTVKGQEKDSMDQLEHRIVEQEGAINTMEFRNYFSLYCLQMETQLIHANLQMLMTMFKNMAEIEIRKHNELCSIWDEIRPAVENWIPSDGGTAPSSPTYDSSPPSF